MTEAYERLIAIANQILDYAEWCREGPILADETVEALRRALDAARQEAHGGAPGSPSAEHDPHPEGDDEDGGL